MEWCGALGIWVMLSLNLGAGSVLSILTSVYEVFANVFLTGKVVIFESDCTDNFQVADATVVVGVIQILIHLWSKIIPYNFELC